MGFSEDLGETYGEVKERLKKALSEFMESEDFSSIASGIEECGDLTELDLEVEDNDDHLSLVASIETTDWGCLPDFTKIVWVFQRVYELAGLRDLVLKQR